MGRLFFVLTLLLTLVPGIAVADAPTASVFSPDVFAQFFVGEYFSIEVSVDGDPAITEPDQKPLGTLTVEAIPFFGGTPISATGTGSVLSHGMCSFYFAECLPPDIYDLKVTYTVGGTSVVVDENVLVILPMEGSGGSSGP